MSSQLQQRLEDLNTIIYGLYFYYFAILGLENNPSIMVNCDWQCENLLNRIFWYFLVLILLVWTKKTNNNYNKCLTRNWNQLEIVLFTINL